MKLAYTRSGSGPILLLLHPVGLDKTFWCQLPELLSQRYTVIALDLPGHGDSPDCGNYTSMGDYVKDVAQFIKTLDVAGVTLAGNSFGGMIAQELALQNPELVARLVISASPGLIAGKLTQASIERGTKALAEGMQSSLDTTLERWFTSAFLSSATVAQVRARLARNKPQNWAAAWFAMSTHDAQLRLPEIKVPTLVVAGGLDMAPPLQFKLDLARSIKDSRLFVLPDAPHMMQLECPGQFARALSDFLLR